MKIRSKTDESAQVVDFQPKRRKKSDCVALCRIILTKAMHVEGGEENEDDPPPPDYGATRTGGHTT
jgi:hypothetical protein